jgi:DUF971 family protein
LLLSGPGTGKPDKEINMASNTNLGARRPAEVMLDIPAACLHLVWGGVRSSLTHAALRASCKCAECEARRRTEGAASMPGAGVTVTALEPAGEAGLRLFFSDGHSRGIFPWGYLFALAYGPR